MPIETKTKLSSYKGLIVWQKGMDLVEKVYLITESFPKTEIYGLSLQMRRSAVSIVSNIAEGSKRGSKKDYRHFVLNAYGSGAELETQLELSKRLKFIDGLKFITTNQLLDEVMKMLNKISQELRD